MNRTRMFAAFGILLILAACTSYYEVKDPTTDKIYYTTNIEENRDGSVTFVDGATEANVTIQNSETREVDKETYKANMPQE